MTMESVLLGKRPNGPVKSTAPPKPEEEESEIWTDNSDDEMEPGAQQCNE